MSSAVQTSLGKADTALQSETYTGTITSVKMNGSTIATSGEANLGTVITQHQDISGKQDVLTAGTNIDITNNVISATDTTYTAGTGIDITNGVISNTQTSANWGNITGTLSNQTDLNTALGGKQETLVSGTNIKTINNNSILGSGNIEIAGGGEVYIGDEQDAPATTKLLIDEDDIDFNGSEVVNSLSGNETNKAPSVSAVNTALSNISTLDVYSETEQRIGTWIDGKPLYRKTLNVGAFDSAVKQFSIPGISFDKLWLDTSNSFGIYSDGGILQLPYLNANSLAYCVGIACLPSLNIVQLDSANVRFTDTFLTLIYTKTTDTANS